MKRASVFLFVGFLGLVFLAASMFWTPQQDSQPAADQPAAGEQPVAGAADDVEKNAAVPVLPLRFPDWPTPAAVLVVTGEQQGYFEPCGCTANQLGGMTRRAGLFRKLRELNWDVRGVDLGSISSRTGVQAQLKFETTLQALRELGYVALGIGPEELRLDPGYLLAQHMTDDADFLGFVSANLTFFGSRDLGTPLAKRIVTVGGWRIGITRVLSETLRSQVLPAGGPSGDAEWSNAEESLKVVLQEFDT